MTEAILSLFSEEAVQYSWRQLAAIAGVGGRQNVLGNGFESLPVDVEYGLHGGENSERRLRIRVRACSTDSWMHLVEGKADIQWLPISSALPEGSLPPFDDTIPVVIWGCGAEDGKRPFVEQSSEGSELLFNADIVATTFLMLSRWEETIIPDRDEHDRFPADASTAYKYGFLDRPIVDEYAIILRSWLKRLLPNWDPIPHRFAVRLSHDIDSVRKSISWRSLPRLIVGDLLYTVKPTLSARTVLSTVRGRFCPERDPYLIGIETLAEISLTHGLRSAFYFKTARQGPRDTGYDILDPLVKDCIKHMQAEVFDV